MCTLKNENAEPGFPCCHAGKTAHDLKSKPFNKEDVIWKKIVYLWFRLQTFCAFQIQPLDKRLKMVLCPVQKSENGGFSLNQILSHLYSQDILVNGMRR